MRQALKRDQGSHKFTELACREKRRVSRGDFVQRERERCRELEIRIEEAHLFREWRLRVLGESPLHQLGAEHAQRERERERERHTFRLV